MTEFEHTVWLEAVTWFEKTGQKVTAEGLDQIDLYWRDYIASCEMNTTSSGFELIF